MHKRILIFDDNQDILNICSIILTGKGHIVRTATACTNLFEHIFDFNPDVIVMDNKIPESGGVEATRLIKKNERTQNIPVILFSANTHVAELTKEAGADCYIQKPFDIREFEDVLDKTINKKEFSDNEAI